MAFTNIEIKAKTERPDDIRNYLLERKAIFKGIDHQTDTYFRVPKGRLKLRQGNVENALIFYERSNEYGPKQSDFNLVPVEDGDNLRKLLEISLGSIAVVKKQREIYFIDNVKFHIDSLETLGNFIEIEASNKDHAASTQMLRMQCEFYMEQFRIDESDLINISYSDMLMEKYSDGSSFSESSSDEEVE